MNRPDIDRPEPNVVLSDYHRRCLDKRIGECDEALAQAVCAVCEAEDWLPTDLSLHALCELMRAAHGLAELAHHISRTGMAMASDKREGRTS